ncbi:MAG: 3-methyl-2-oxobutanoate hydroxymethyltransferase, partial [Deltaproteobacteria bacterium]|nr:3-methyl-2-oxobutanoate hydroxymethyltransferase [Deltaproteobacteria bacterium]
GHTDTLPVTLEEMIYHTRCVARGTQNAHLTTDLPFLSYQVSPEHALTAAGRVLKEGGAQSVKLEGGVSMAPTIARLVEVGIPVIGHVGLTPQSVHAMGGFRVQGRTESDAARVLADAQAVADAGAFCVVLEGIPSDLAADITAAIQVPTIGIGAGPACDGQVLVCYDLLGLDLRFKPRFVKHYAQLETTVVDAFKAYVDEVRSGAFPTEEHGFSRAASPLKRVY